MYYLDMVSKMNKYLIFSDLETLDIYCEYLFNDKSKAINHSNLLNLYELIDRMDEAAFLNQDAKMARYLFIKFYLEARVSMGISKRKLCVKHAIDSIDKRYHLIIRREILDSIPQDEMDRKGIEFINGLVFTNLNYIFMHKYKVALIGVVEDIENNRIPERSEDLIPLFQAILSDLTTSKRRSVQSNSFNLSDELAYRALLKEAVARLSSDANYLITGWHGMNVMLNGGFENGRVYNIIGGTGGFKSGMLLNIFKSFKKYNKGRVKRTANMRSTILFISQENNLWETIQRIFNIFATVNHIKNYTYTEVIDMLKNGGFSIVNDEDDIDLEFRYYGNEDIGVADIRGMVEELENDGKEVCAIIQDYIERLRPPKRNVEKRQQLADISNQLHDLAVDLDIPIVTASQLNRNGVAIIEQMHDEEDFDKASSVGQRDISESFGMLKNIDVNILVIPIFLKEENRFYLYMKKLKFRGADEAKLQEFYQPFEGENSKIMLIDDIDLAEPVYRRSMNSNNYESMKPVAKFTTSVTKRKPLVKLTTPEDDDADLDDLINSYKKKSNKEIKLKPKFNDRLRRQQEKLAM